MGKTTLSTALARQFARLGQRVVFVDFDVQGNASRTLRNMVQAEDLPACVDLFSRELKPEETAQINAQSFYLAASTPALADADNLDPYQAIRLLNANLAGLQYDLAIFDTSPTLSRQMLIAAGISKDVLIPVEPSEIGLDGAAHFLQFLINLRNSLRAAGIECQAVVMGLAVNRMEFNKPRKVKLLHDLQSAYNDFMLKSVICSRDAFAEALDAGIDVRDIPKRSARKAVAEIEALFKEVQGKLHD